MKTAKIGVIGCGNISDIYFKNLTELYRNTEIICCCDLNGELAVKAAEKYNIPKICTFEEMLSDEAIDIILNLTPPKAHYSISKKALLAGKNVYSEKPLSIELSEGEELVKLASEKGVLLGCAPDTFMGAGIQTAKKLIDDGVIGYPVAATAFFGTNGPEDWHPNPEFFYKYGAGPMLDMGPYDLTALIALLGGIDTICGFANISRPTRTITSEPKKGQTIEVEVPTHVNGSIKFKCGAVGSLITSFDVWKNTMPFIEIYGTEGTINVPDPNFFDGPVKVQTRHDAFTDAPLVSPYKENVRGLGVSDMAKCIINGGDIKASGTMALHVLEAMHAFQISSDTGTYYKMTTQAEKPLAMAPNLTLGEV